jgi:hypothetical protein
MDEFATTVLGDPWDMKESSDLAFFYPAESGLQNGTFVNGIYSAQMTAGTGGERVTLLTSGAQNHAAMRIGKIGYNYPIDANKYRYLSFRMYSSNTACNSGTFQWFEDDSGTSDKMGVANGYLVPPLPCFGRPAGWYTYTLDLPSAGLAQGGKTWSGVIRELIMHPFAGESAAGATVKLDWVRLTAANPLSARPYTIAWTGDGTGGPVTLWASPGDKVLDADDILIAENQAAGPGQFVFQTGILPAGEYWIAATNQSGIAWSTGPLTINAPPKITITRPSRVSGEDYAATQLGNPWDMNDPGDLNDSVPPPMQTCVTNESYAAGIYSAVVPSPVCPAGASYADPILFLGGMDRNPPGVLDPLIDTNKYRYLTYRFRESGLNFSVSRFGWWQVNATDNGVIEAPVMSRDVLLVDGWHTYSLDLWSDDLVDETLPSDTPSWLASHPNRLRFDPNELAASMLPVMIQMDWIKLTAMDTATRGAPFPIQILIDHPPAKVATSFFFTTDPVASPYQHAARAFAPADPVPGPYRVYLPQVLRGYSGGDEEPGELTFLWDTAGVATGTYYVCVVADDRYNAVTACSDAPMLLR